MHNTSRRTWEIFSCAAGYASQYIKKRTRRIMRQDELAVFKVRLERSKSNRRGKRLVRLIVHPSLY